MFIIYLFPVIEAFPKQDPPLGDLACWAGDDEESKEGITTGR